MCLCDIINVQVPLPDGSRPGECQTRSLFRRDQPPSQPSRTLDALLAAMPTPEEQRQAEDRWRARVVSDAGGDASTLNLVAQVSVTWIGMVDDGRFDVVEDATSRRWLLLHEWGELAVVDPEMLNALSERLAEQIAELAGLKRLVNGEG